MAKVALDGTINIQGTKEIDRTNLAQLREPTTNDKGDCGRTEHQLLLMAANRQCATESFCSWELLMRMGYFNEASGGPMTSPCWLGGLRVPL